MRKLSVLKQKCTSVNEVLKAEAIKLNLGTKISLPRLEGCKNDLSSFSYWAEMEFREYIRRQLEQHPGNVGGLINGGARLLGISPATTKRYMAKLRSEGGPFGGLGDVVIINPNYVAKEDDDYWLDANEEDKGDADQD